MKKSAIIVSAKDYEILSGLAKNHQSVDPMAIKCREKLFEELQSADVRPIGKMPKNVVQLDSIITVNTTFGRKVGLKLVLPAYADFNQRKLSIMTPIGTAIVGYKAGDNVLWHFPKGDEIIQIEQVDNSQVTAVETIKSH